MSKLTDEFKNDIVELEYDIHVLERLVHHKKGRLRHIAKLLEDINARLWALGLDTIPRDSSNLEMSCFWKRGELGDLLRDHQLRNRSPLGRM